MERKEAIAMRHLDALIEHPDLRKAFPQRFDQWVWDLLEYDPDADIDAYAERLRRTVSYKAWRILHALRLM